MRAARIRRDEGAVSPIVGSILILVIMILAIGGIIAWGVPAIQGLQQRAEYGAVLTQFLQMESDVRNLRDPQNTRISTISLAEGHLNFTTGDRWVIIGARDAAYTGLYVTGYEGTNPANVNLLGVAIPGSAEITVDKVDGGTFTTKFNCASSCGSSVSLGGAQLNTDVVRIQVKDGAGVKSEIWILNVGRLSYRLSDTNDLNMLHFEMGAVFTQNDKAFFLEDAPTIKDPDYTVSPKDTSLFVRAMQMTGTTQNVGGKGRFPIVYHLVDNYGFSRGRPSFDPAYGVRIEVDGLLEVPFCNYFDQRPGWVQVDASGNPTSCPTTGTSGSVNLRYDKGAESLVYDLSHSVVSTTVRSI